MSSWNISVITDQWWKYSELMCINNVIRFLSNAPLKRTEYNRYLSKWFHVQYLMMVVWYIHSPFRSTQKYSPLSRSSSLSLSADRLIRWNWLLGDKSCFAASILARSFVDVFDFFSLMYNIWKNETCENISACDSVFFRFNDAYWMLYLRLSLQIRALTRNCKSRKRVLSFFCDWFSANDITLNYRRHRRNMKCTISWLFPTFSVANRLCRMRNQCSLRSLTKWEYFWLVSLI